jgi:hypothetical protein
VLICFILFTLILRAGSEEISDGHPTKHLVCKCSPTSFFQNVFTIIFNLHKTEIRALQRGEKLAPALLYAHVHWTGQFLILMEFVEGVNVTPETGLTNVNTIDNIIIQLARFHSKTIHFGKRIEPTAIRSVRLGNVTCSSGCHVTIRIGQFFEVFC